MITQEVIANAYHRRRPRLRSATAPIGFVLGAEYRKYTATRLSDEASQTPGAVVGGGGAAPDVFGKFNVKDFFAEVAIPVIEDSFVDL